MPKPPRNISVLVSPHAAKDKTLCTATGRITHKVRSAEVPPDFTASVVTYCGKELVVKSHFNGTASWGLWLSREKGWYSEVTCSECVAVFESVKDAEAAEKALRS